MINKLFSYIQESKEEMRKVTWPSKKDTTRYSLLVIGISLVIAFFFGGLDWLLQLGLEQLVKLSS
ncbi:MAG: preprotein translocase subunit SecE [Patescibacteria group bacterium]